MFMGQFASMKKRRKMIVSFKAPQSFYNFSVVRVLTLCQILNPDGLDSSCHFSGVHTLELLYSVPKPMR